jgi:uncharacterized protein YndB with AHSA1/START domain
MQRLHFSTTIDAPKDKVWHTMLADETYRQWTSVFAAGSHYQGDWKEGSKILFLAPEDNGNSGMVSRIAENRPYEFISIEHLGEVRNGREDTGSDAAKSWRGARENYTFQERDGMTEVSVDVDIVDEYRGMFEQKWPEALNRLKGIVEGSAPEAIVVSTTIKAPVGRIWEYWNKPEHITNWAFASDDWEASAAENDVRVGGKFKIRMAAKDASAGFDFTGTYTAVKNNELIAYDMDDGRHVKVQFFPLPEGVQVTETFDPENTHPHEVQRAGWQAILDNFRKYVESNRR